MVTYIIVISKTYSGKAIEDAIWIAHTQGGKVYSLNGLIYAKLSTADSHSLNETEALDQALTHVDAEVYKWQMAGEEEHFEMGVWRQ